MFLFSFSISYRIVAIKILFSPAWYHEPAEAIAYLLTSSSLSENELITTSFYSLLSPLHGAADVNALFLSDALHGSYFSPYQKLCVRCQLASEDFLSGLPDS